MPVIQRAGRNRKMPLIATGKQDGAPAALLADWVEGRTSYHGGVVAFLTMLAALGGIRRLVSVSSTHGQAEAGACSTALLSQPALVGGAAIPDRCPGPPHEMSLRRAA